MIWEAIKSLLLSIKEVVINHKTYGIGTLIFKAKKEQTIGMCIRDNAKYYLIQKSYFSWMILRAADVDYNKKLGNIEKHITAKDLHKISAFVADPMHYR